MKYIGQATAAAILAFSVDATTAKASMQWGETETYTYYSDEEMQAFLADNRLEVYMSANRQPHGGYPEPDIPPTTRIYTNEDTGRWLMTYETYIVSDGLTYQTYEEPRHRVTAYGSYFALHPENQGRARSFYESSNHGLCQNITSPPWFYGSTNLVFMGLDHSINESNSTLIMIFTGTGGMIQPETSGYIVEQRPDRGCYWNARIHETLIEKDNIETISLHP